MNFIWIKLFIWTKIISKMFISKMSRSSIPLVRNLTDCCVAYCLQCVRSNSQFLPEVCMAGEPPVSWVCRNMTLSWLSGKCYWLGVSKIKMPCPSTLQIVMSRKKPWPGSYQELPISSPVFLIWGRSKSVLWCSAGNYSRVSATVTLDFKHITANNIRMDNWYI